MTMRVGGVTGEEMEYAVAAAMVPGAIARGAACSSTFKWPETCRCDSCSVPVSATMSAV